MRYANTEKTVIQVDVPRAMPDGSIQTDTLNIPVDARNAHYRELVGPWLQVGNVPAAYVPPPETKSEVQVMREQLEALMQASGAQPTADFHALAARANAAEKA